MAKLYIPIGIPGSGKSTWAKKQNVKWISSDAIREELDVKNPFDVMIKRTTEALKRGEDVIYDATNIKRKDRRVILDVAKRLGCETEAILFLTPEDECRRRNSLREGKACVPEYVIDRMLRNFEVPFPNEFNKISAVQDSLDKRTLDTKISQDNPHHDLRLDEHMDYASKIMAENAPDDKILNEAAKQHDIGKIFTKSFKNSKGEITPIAHFYGHENYGAYYYLTSHEFNKETLDIARVINYHMRPMVWKKSEKALASDKRDFGEDLIKRLELMNICDEGAKTKNIESFILDENLEKLAKDKKIKVGFDFESSEKSQSATYGILKYDIDANFNDPIVKQSRGIIFDADARARGEREGLVVCRPFNKFSNYSEDSADKIDWNSARVEQKIDGSLIKLWNANSERDNEWHFSTNGTIHASDAQVNEEMNFQELIEKSDNFKDIDFSKLDKNNTYMFELVSPLNQVVVKYPKTHLYHIGTRSKDGQEFLCDIGVEKPKKYDVKSLNDCIKLAENMNKDGQVTEEGFVVVDKDFNRIKVKSPQYILLHRAVNNNNITTKRILEFISAGDEEILLEHDDARLRLLETKAALAKLEFAVEKEVQDARAWYKEFDFDRKATAEKIKESEYSVAGFRALNDENYKASDYIESLNVSKLSKMVDSVIKEDRMVSAMKRLDNAKNSIYNLNEGEDEESEPESSLE